MLARIPESPPVIKPLPAGVVRPLWSVMIPVYNCYQYIPFCLEGVLAQDPGPEKMQIAVVDDCSTDGDVEALVAKIGKGRVEYYRQEKNMGSLRNFELALNKSRGEYIHLLHGDDGSLKGYYEEIESLFEENPGIGAAFTSCYIVDENNHFRANVRKISNEKGVLKDWLQRIAIECWIQPPSITVKREVYEKLGGFFAVHYGEDWEMWTRIAKDYEVAYSDKILSFYRAHSDNISTRSTLSGQNIKDILKVVDIIQGYLPEKDRRRIKIASLRNFSIYFSRQAHFYYEKTGKVSPILHQLKGAFKMYPNIFSGIFISLLLAKMALFPKKRKKKEAGLQATRHISNG